MRKKIVNDKKLKEILEERGVIYKEIGKINEKIVALDKERTKWGYKMDRLKEKTAPFVEKYISPYDLDEFEIVSRVYLEKGEIIFEIIDKIEEYKNILREEVKQKGEIKKIS